MNDNMYKTIGIIGFGNMGSAIAERIKTQYQVYVFDKDKEKTNNLSNIVVTRDIADLAQRVDVIILAVKPQDFNGVLNEIRENVKNKLIISIAAGITNSYIEKYLGQVRVVRAMPNLPAKIGKGIICLSRGKFCGDNELIFSLEIFSHLGKTLLVDEKQMNAVTAIYGSGPAFISYFMESENIKVQNIPSSFNNKYEKIFTKLAEDFIHLDIDSASVLANTIVAGTIALLKETSLSPSELRKNVTSKGGTTQAGLGVLDKGGSLEEAVEAAIKRAEKLSRR